MRVVVRMIRTAHCSFFPASTTTLRSAAGFSALPAATRRIPDRDCADHFEAAAKPSASVPDRFRRIRSLSRAASLPARRRGQGHSDRHAGGNEEAGRDDALGGGIDHDKSRERTRHGSVTNASTRPSVTVCSCATGRKARRQEPTARRHNEHRSRDLHPRITAGSADRAADDDDTGKHQHRWPSRRA